MIKAGLELHELVQGWIDRATGHDQSISLTDYAKQCVLTHRMIIQNSLVNEDVMPGIISMVSQQIVGLVMVALNMDSYISDSRTVRDVIKTVATESFVDSVDLIKFNGIDVTSENRDEFEDMDIIGALEEVGQEKLSNGVVDLEPKMGRLMSMRVVEIDLNFKTAKIKTVSKVENSSDRGFERSSERTRGTSNDKSSEGGTSTNQGPTKTVYDENNNVTSVSDGRTTTEHGKVVDRDGSKDETRRRGGNSRREGAKVGSEVTTETGSMTITLGIHLVPYFISNAVAKNWMSYVAKPTLRLRFKKALAGEISWVKDFILCFDLIKKYQDLLRGDKSGELNELFKQSKSGIFKAFLQTFKKQKSHNLANSIVILDKQTFEMSCTDNGVDFSSYLQREKYFKNTMGMFLIVVDEMYGQVTIYGHGLKMVTEATFDWINKIGTKSDSYDIKDIVTAFGTNTNIRY